MMCFFNQPFFIQVRDFFARQRGILNESALSQAKSLADLELMQCKMMRLKDDVSILRR